jgi:hypothetical protein
MKGFRTILFNVAAAALTVVVGANWVDVLAAHPWAPPLIIALANVGLRYVTTTPVGQPR